MTLLHLLIAVAAQTGGVPLPPPPEPSSIDIRPGERPEGQPAPVSETAEPVGLALAAFDANRDGRTSREEAEGELGRTFDQADSNGDGQLGYLEYSAWAETWLGSQTALPGPYAIDVSGDDRISRDEFMEAFRREFARFDRNGDGILVHAELLTVRNPRLAPIDRETMERFQRRRRGGR